MALMIIIIIGGILSFMFGAALAKAWGDSRGY